MERHVLVAPPGAGRLDRWLAEVLPISRSRIQELVRLGRVTVDGRSCKASLSLEGDEQVVVEVPPPPPSELVRDAIPVPILHMDEDLLVVDKPAGLVVHPAKGHDRGTLVNALLHHLDEAGGDPSRPGVVHRLDKGTSGVMVVARTPRAMERLAADFASHDLDRRYLALVKGKMPAPAGVVRARLGRHPTDRKRFAVVQAGGKEAVTRWAVRGEARLPVPGARDGGVLSLVECRLETGRTHQVRVHMAHLGHPVLCDPLYRSNGLPPPALRPLLEPIDHQLLHAWHLSIRHPITGAWLSFTVPPPADFRAVLAACDLEVPRAPGRDLAARDIVPPSVLDDSEAR
ncbi:RluA family pseudouridine synthase [Myxococcota bacterium]|nr:RluA family pseudouridine synthase [Myxococcota bacterium]